jgi:hypothetical protein
MIEQRRILYLLPLFFLLLGMKSELSSNSDYPIIKFHPYSNQLTNEGKVQIDSLVVLLNRHPEILQNWSIVVNPVHLALENDSNCYLGLDRYRTLISELKKRHHNSNFQKIYYNDNTKFLEDESKMLTGLHLQITN